MGRKQAGAGKQIHLCIAVLIFLFTIGCAVTTEQLKSGERQVKGEEGQANLVLGRKLFAEGDYAGALRELEKAASLSRMAAVTEESLLYLGLVYAHSGNPKRDYGKSAFYFKKLAKNYPRSPIAEQAKIMIAVFQENDELSRNIERLNEIIEESKKVDIGIEDKKRGRTP